MPKRVWIFLLIAAAIVLFFFLILGSPIPTGP